MHRADDANTPSAKRSVKIWRPHRTASQRKRRAITRSCTIRPERGRSVTRRRYRLWTRRETVPQDGHRPTLPDARTAITALSPSKYALSTTNPLGTRLERWSACCMAADSPQNQSARSPSNCIKSESEPNWDRHPRYEARLMFSYAVDRLLRAREDSNSRQTSSRHSKGDLMTPHLAELEFPSKRYIHPGG